LISERIVMVTAVNRQCSKQVPVPNANALWTPSPCPG